MVCEVFQLPTDGARAPERAAVRPRGAAGQSRDWNRHRCIGWQYHGGCHERTIRCQGTSKLRWPGLGRAGTACPRAPGESADRAEGTAFHRSLRGGAQHPGRLAQRGGSPCRFRHSPAGPRAARPRGPCRQSLTPSECSRRCSTGRGCLGLSLERRPWRSDGLPACHCPRSDVSVDAGIRSSTATPSASASLRRVRTDPLPRPASISTICTRLTPEARASAACD